MLNTFGQALAEREGEDRRDWDPPSILTPWQLDVFNDPAEVVVTDAGRRTGKTKEFAVELLDDAVTKPGQDLDFAAKTEIDAKDLLYDDLDGLNTEFRLGGRWRKNVLRFPNKSKIRLTGAKDPGEAQRKWRGRGKDKVILDEVQMLPYLREMLFEAILPALVRGGRNGRLKVGGTPGEVEGVGCWEEIRAGKFPKWSIHVGTIYDNPHVTDVDAFLAARAAELGGYDSPTFQREYLRNNKLGPGVDSTLVYRYSKDRNHPEGIRIQVIETPEGKGRVFLGLPGGKWIYLLAVDLGHVRDASSIWVCGITDAAPGKIWLVEEWLFGKRPKQTALAEGINARIAKYRPVVSLCDEGALGAQSADWLRAEPYSVPISAADKAHALATTDALNAALLSGAWQISAESQTAQDLVRLRWDPKKMQTGKRVMALEPHSDLEPCMRYLWPVASGILASVKAPPPRKTEEELESDEIRAELAQGASDKWWKKRR